MLRHYVGSDDYEHGLCRPPMHYPHYTAALHIDITISSSDSNQQSVHPTHQMLDLTHIILVFTVLVCVTAVAKALLSHTDETPETPHDVIAAMVIDSIQEHGVVPLPGN